MSKVLVHPRADQAPRVERRLSRKDIASDARAELHVARRWLEKVSSNKKAVQISPAAWASMLRRVERLVATADSAKLAA